MLEVELVGGWYDMVITPMEYDMNHMIPTLAYDIPGLVVADVIKYYYCIRFMMHFICTILRVMASYRMHLDDAFVIQTQSH